MSTTFTETDASSYVGSETSATSAGTQSGRSGRSGRRAKRTDRSPARKPARGARRGLRPPPHLAPSVPHGGTGVSSSAPSSAHMSSTSTGGRGRRPWPFKARHGVCVRPFHIADRDPNPRRRYFPPLPVHLRGRPTIAVCVPCYNEEHHTMQRTLNGLAIQQWELSLEFGDQAPILYVVGLVDGVDKAAPSMLTYLNELVGFNRSMIDDTPSTAHILCCPVDHRERELGVTLFNVEDARRVDAPAPVVEEERVEILDKLHWKLPLFVTMMVKRANGRKHHSHEWFFNGLCASIRADLAFSTDVGTLYNSGMLTMLYTHMLKHQDCSACCGHQEVMTWVDQTPPSEMKAGTEESFQSTLLRACQRFDFVSGQALFKGSHAMSGFLSVLPGPCGLYRYAYLNHPGPDGKTALDHYFELVKVSALETNLITANLKIAEDRILSYVAVLRAARPVLWDDSCFAAEIEDPDAREEEYEWMRNCKTNYIPRAQFFFESESPLSELVKQRRRWLNGTSAGYIWLLGELLATWPDRDHGFVFDIVCTLNLLFQIMIFVSLFVFPSIVLIAYQLSLDGIIQLAIAWSSPFELVNKGIDMEDALIPPVLRDTVYIIGGIIMAWYVITLLALMIVSMRDSYHHGLWMSLTISGAIVVQVQLFALFGASVTFLCNPIARRALILEIADIANDPNLVQAVEWYRFAAIIGLSYLAMPYILVLLTSGLKEFYSMLPPTAFIYMTFSATMVGGFFGYSLARISDLGWGTKENAPASEVEMEGMSDRQGVRVIGEVRDDGGFESYATQTDNIGNTDASSDEDGDQVDDLPDPERFHGGAGHRPHSPGASTVGGMSLMMLDEEDARLARLPRSVQAAVRGGAERRKARTQREVDDAFKLVSMSALERFRTQRYGVLLTCIVANFVLTTTLSIYKNENPAYLVMFGVIAAGPGLWPFSRSLFYAVIWRTAGSIRKYFSPREVICDTVHASGLPPPLLEMRDSRAKGKKAVKVYHPPPKVVTTAASSSKGASSARAPSAT